MAKYVKSEIDSGKEFYIDSIPFNKKKCTPTSIGSHDKRSGRTENTENISARKSKAADAVRETRLHC